MRITLHKFGTTLVSRQTGSEAFKALQPELRGIKPGEQLEIDFSGVNTLSPSWADEFITPLHEQYAGSLILFPSENSSVNATLNFLEKIHKWGN